MKRVSILAAISALFLVGSSLPAGAAEMSAMNLKTDLVLHTSPGGAGLSGGCTAQHGGTGNTLHIVVEGAVTTTGATGMTVVCHLQQGWRYRAFGLLSAGSAAAGGGAVTNWALADYDLCTEIHAVFLDGSRYDKDC